ncbi:unnamed protein product [Camellia sinensis]
MSEKEKMDKENTHRQSSEPEEKNKEREVTTEREDGRKETEETNARKEHFHPSTRELLVSIRFNKPGWQWSGCFLPDHLNEACCIDVEILSRCLEAELTVCCCSFSRDKESCKEDDWTCPSCGNVKFSFRTTCNMHNRTQSRPADYNSKSAAKPIQPMHVYSSSAPYIGSGAPSSMYMGVPPYGSSLFNGSSMSPYDVPFSGGSAYPYNYGSRLSGGSPYRPLHIACPTPYSSGSMIGNGRMYGMPPLMDCYGLGMGMAMGHADMVAKSDSNSKHKMLDGSWKCEKCNNINYPFRTKCNRQNCGADKPSEGQKSPSEPADENDQFYRKCLWVEKGPESASSSYAHYGCLKVNDEIPASTLASHPLVLTALSSLNSDILSEASVNVI